MLSLLQEMISSRLSRSCLGDLTKFIACWPAGVDLYRAMWAGGSPRAPDSVSGSAKLAWCERKIPTAFHLFG